MLVKRFLVILLVISISLLGTVACTSNSQDESAALEAGNGEGVMVDVAPMTIQGESSSDLAVSNTDSAAIQTGSGEGVVVDVTPMTDSELASQPLEQTEPGASAGDGGAQDNLPPIGKSIVYPNDTYMFSVDYPANFVLHTQPADKLSQLDPEPTASFIFMNPETAASEQADLEPADLELRVYAASQTDSLQSWLTSVGLLPADGSVPMQSFDAANVSGVQVCASTMIAPGCSYFFIGNGWVYQLTPATLEGEAMSKTFRLMP